ncbi:hypothetical protein AUJ84_00080 [Candidatus Pacearchaeota archaeon CG1_02_32_132]|nr:MAG: hypothetical protein AUJ84_00080 [Candidatus Pacearchaeota archaeon CG1_02_32_132]
MVKGVAIKFSSYGETIPKLLNLIKFDKELKKHDKIVLKPSLIEGEKEKSTKAEFVEQILKFCAENKNPGTEIFIAEGCDGADTENIFDKFGYRELSEKYGVGLIDLNHSETEVIERDDFLRFSDIYYPKILKESFVISLPFLREDNELEMAGSLSNMIGAFPSSKYTGFFSSNKNKIRKWPMKYAIHDILKCKMPEFSIIDASSKGGILAGQPLEMDKQAAKALKHDWKQIGHLKLVDEGFHEKDKDKKVDELEEL